MKLTRIADGRVIDVKIPDPIVLTKASKVGKMTVVERWESKSGSSDYTKALQSWAYRNGYEVPGG